MHSSRWIVNTRLTESFSGRKRPNRGGNGCFEHHHNYYGWCQCKTGVLGSSHSEQGMGHSHLSSGCCSITVVIYWTDYHTGCSPAFHSSSSSFFYIAYNGLIKWILEPDGSGTLELWWFRSTSHFLLQQCTSILYFFHRWAFFSSTLLTGQPDLPSPQLWREDLSSEEKTLRRSSKAPGSCWLWLLPFQSRWQTSPLFLQLEFSPLPCPAAVQGTLCWGNPAAKLSSCS